MELGRQECLPGDGRRVRQKPKEAGEEKPLKAAEDMTNRNTFTRN